MARDRESAVAAWLDQPSTKREIAIAQCRLSLMGREVSTYDATMFALGIEILSALNIYGTNDGGTNDPEDGPWGPE